MPLRKTVLACLTALLALPLAAEPLRVAGLVRTLPGSPSPKSVRAELMPTLDPAAPPVSSADVQPDGFFELTAPEAGFYSVILRAPGFEALRHDQIILEETFLPPADLFSAFERIELRLTGPSGLPLAGVPVASIPAPDEISERPWTPFEPASAADDAGRVRVADLKVPVPLRLRLLDPRFLGELQAPAVTGPVAVPRRRPALLEVFLPSGQPAAGAVVRWDGERVASIGPEGRVSLVLPDTGKLTVEAPGLWAAVPAGKPSGPAAEASAPVRIQLVPLQPRAGRVFDAATRRPLAGAWVWAEPLHAGTVAVRSDAEGRFSLPLPPAWTGRLMAAAPGYLPGTPTPAGLQASTLELQPAAAISGRAVDPEGHAVAGAWIEAGMPGRPANRWDPVQPTRVRTAADGGFRLPALLPDGLYELAGTHADFPRTTLEVRTAPAGRATPPVRLVLDRGQTGFGRVVGPDGSPVAGAEVVLLPDAETEDRFGATSGPAGEVEIRRLRPGTFTLLARREGFGPVVRRGFQVPPRTPRVALGDIELPPPAVIEGRVTDPAGRPVDGARIYASGAHSVRVPGDAPEASWDVPGLLTTGADGAFRFDNLQPSQPYLIVAMHPDYAPARLPDVMAPVPGPLRITLTPAHALTGRMVGPDREPVAGAQLTQVVSTEVTYEHGSGASGTSQPLGQTDAAGRFRIPGLAPGQIDLQIQATGYRQRTVKGIQIPAAGDPPALEIVLERGAVLEGRVTDGRGEGVAGVWVVASPNRRAGDSPFGGTFSSSTTGPDGTYRIAELAPGPHHVSADERAGRSLQEDKEIRPGVNHLDFALPGGHEVSGWVREDDGSPVPGAQVTLSPLPGGTVLSMLAGVDGAFRKAGIPAGRYRVQAAQTGFVESSPVPELEVGDGDIQGLELRLTRSPMAIVGRLLGLSPEQQSRLQIEAQAQGVAGGWRRRPGRLDGRGGYRIPDLIPGEWAVQAYDPEGRRVYGQVRVEPGVQETALDLDFSGGLTLSGRVVSNGQPLSEARVDLTGGPGGGGTATTGYDGAFRVAGLQAGTFTLVVTSPAQGISQSRSVTLDGDRDLTIEIETGALSGRVLSGKTGTPVAGVTVELAVLGEKITVSGPSVLTGPDGTFALPALAAGTYRATLRGPGSSKVEQTVTVPPGGSVNLEMTVPE
jgi:protocatechuate 3,4-dioxygenase beta subunit